VLCSVVGANAPHLKAARDSWGAMAIAVHRRHIQMGAFLISDIVSEVISVWNRELYRSYIGLVSGLYRGHIGVICFLAPADRGGGGLGLVRVCSVKRRIYYYTRHQKKSDIFLGRRISISALVHWSETEGHSKQS
jgi:hypothetical protein